MSPIDFSIFDEIVFYPTCTEKPILKFLYNKFFSIYNYLFRFFCLFGFQWTVSRTLCTLVGPSGLEPPLKLISRYAREKPLTLLKGSRSYLDLLVGPSGLEPPTSCLSGTRSNLLSYEPIRLVCDFRFTWVGLSSLVEMMGFEPMTPCLQGRCSPSWATPPYNMVRSFLLFGIRKEGLSSSLSEVSALSYLPVQSPVKYFRHCRA